MRWHIFFIQCLVFLNYAHFVPCLSANLIDHDQIAFVMLLVKMIQNIVFEGSCGNRLTPLLTINHFVIIIFWVYVSRSSSKLPVFARAVDELLVYYMRQWIRSTCCHHLHPMWSCCLHKPLPQNKNKLLGLTVCIWVCVFVGLTDRRVMEQ